MTREEVAQAAMALPAATRIVLWDRLDVYKVGGKVFASCGDGEGLSFKASEIAYAVLTEDGPGRPAPGFARGRWVNLPLADCAAWEVTEWLAASHTLAAESLGRAVRRELGLG